MPPTDLVRVRALHAGIPCRDPRPDHGAGGARADRGHGDRLDGAACCATAWTARRPGARAGAAQPSGRAPDQPRRPRRAARRVRGGARGPGSAQAGFPVSPWREWRRRRALRQCRLPVQQQALQAPLPTSSTPFEQLPAVALDFETTGLDPHRPAALRHLGADRRRPAVHGREHAVRVRPRGGRRRPERDHPACSTATWPGPPTARCSRAAGAGRARDRGACGRDRARLLRALRRHGGVPLPTVHRHLALPHPAGRQRPRPRRRGGLLTLAAARASRRRRSTRRWPTPWPPSCCCPGRSHVRGRRCACATSTNAGFVQVTNPDDAPG